MGRRVEVESPAKEVEAATAKRRARQLSLRLSMSGAAAEGTPLRRQLDAAMEIPDARARLTAVLDLADQIRPTLPPDVQWLTLPESLSQWRAAA